MIVIIDGYNLLKQIYASAKGKLDKQKKQLIRQLGHYKVKKSKDIKEIVLVFDGGPLRHATREVHFGVVEVYAGQKNSADDWILNYVKKHKNEEMLLITKDRELKDRCKKYGVDSVSVFDFYDLLQNSLLDDVKEEIVEHDNKSHVHKFEDEFDDEYKHKIDSQALDFLMEQTGFESYKKEDDYKEQQKKGKSKTLSKKEKSIYKKIKKL